MTPDIRWSRPHDRDTILTFIQQMGFNPRDAAAWDALNMCAMTAWQGGNLIGAIPLEPRPFRITPTQTIPTAHETVVAIHPDHRAQGIGSAMQTAIAENPPAGTQLITVFREDPQSPAYRWYLKNNFTPLMHIDSWFWDAPSSPDINIELYRAHDPRLDYEALQKLWLRTTQECAGFVDRNQRPLDQWLPIHPYRSRYQFYILLHRHPNRSIAGYALIGVGKMHSPTNRIDILDLITSNNNPEPLLYALQRLSTTQNWRPIRWPLATQDPNTTFARNNGFTNPWGFDLLIRQLPSPALSIPPSTITWRYAGIDYI
jgi:GNAT superfamily N-acetyltransferase